MLSDCLDINSVTAHVFSGNRRFDGKEAKKSSVKLTVSQELLGGIISVRNCSIKKISEETQIPLDSLYLIKSGYTKHPRSATFKKIFNLYCQVCE